MIVPIFQDNLVPGFQQITILYQKQLKSQHKIGFIYQLSKFESQINIQQIQMKVRLLYTLLGVGIGGSSYHGYKYYNPERNINHSSRQMINSYVSKHQLEQGYLINVLKSVGLMLKGFYHYGMDTKIQGFNYNSTFVKREEVRNDDKDVRNLYCIFSPTDYICGHPEIQHGGATATIIDQNMGYLAILNSKQMVATGDLHIKYKKPIKKDQFYVLQAQVTKRNGRKIWVKGVIKQLQTGQVKVESEALFFTVNWDNQMSRILTKFFQVINYKDYSQQNHAHNIYRQYQQSQVQPRVHEAQKAVISLSLTKQEKQLEEKLAKVEKIVQQLQSKQNIVQVPPLETFKLFQQTARQDKSTNI